MLGSTEKRREGWCGLSPGSHLTHSTSQKFPLTFYFPFITYPVLLLTTSTGSTTKSRTKVKFSHHSRCHPENHRCSCGCPKNIYPTNRKKAPLDREKTREYRFTNVPLAKCCVSGLVIVDLLFVQLLYVHQTR